MAWKALKTDYKDMAWSGLKKYTQIDNNDGTLSFQDVTAYTDKEKSFFGAKDANQMNEALNYIMTKLENGTDLYSEFQEFFRSQKERFLASGQATLEELKQAAKMDRDTFEQFIKDLKNQSVARMEIYENQQKAVFELWFKEIKATLSGDVAGNLATKITALEDKIKTKIDQISTTDEAFINTLLNNTGKVGQDYLFGSKGDKNGTISESLDFTLYKSLNNCVHYSGYQIDVVNLRGQNEGLRDAHFKEPAYYLATFVEAKKVAIRILTTPIEVTNDLIDSSTERALSAAQGKWLNENKLGKNDKAADSDKLDGHDSTYFATSADVQTAQRAATQGINAAAAAHGRANEAYSRAEQAFTSASNGKITIANAITGKGIPTSTTASWQELAGNIGKIGTFKKIHMGQYDFGQSDDWAYQYVLGYGAYLNVFEMREPIINAYVVLNITTQHYMYSNHPNVERKFYVFFGETRDEFKAQVEYDNNSGLITAIHGNYDTINTYDGVLNGHKITYGIFSKHKKFSIPMKYMAIAIHNTNNFVVENFIKKCALLTL